ncbi:hypothetical protein [Allorhizobium taibaishanense]|uniref:Uncharacterized protein n=1 Tax=Allorhizobium taibaishanense TaxID=887144 RepID=A0A7W6MT63_9HYPH|nr:hypothetical protein [Allorhizobium taibaishanense]MBB4006800.1 hypothetical protein [Allorhizobium taibaishanense]
MAKADDVLAAIPKLLISRQIDERGWSLRVSFLKQRFSKIIYIIIFAVGIFSAYFYYLVATDYRKNPARVAFILNISELPRSVRDIECSAGAITDLIVTCAFRVHSDDFQPLLSGWRFKSDEVSGDGRDYGTDAKVGPSFDAALQYSVYPESFKRGGRVDLVTNRDQTMVVANRYEE